MPMIPDDEILRIKQTADIAAVIRARGVELKRSGGDLVGRCPFHDDHDPSLRVTPAKGLWRCMAAACGATGNVIQFVQKFDGVSFRHAFELLKSNAAFNGAPSCSPVKKATIPKLPAPVAGDADDQAALRQRGPEGVRTFFVSFFSDGHFFCRRKLTKNVLLRPLPPASPDPLGLPFGPIKKDSRPLQPHNRPLIVPVVPVVPVAPSKIDCCRLPSTAVDPNRLSSIIVDCHRLLSPPPPPPSRAHEVPRPPPCAQSAAHRSTGFQPVSP